MSWNNRYKAMLKVCSELDIAKNGGKFGNKEVAEITGNTYGSVKSTTQPNKSFPRNLKLAIVIFERMSENVQIGGKK